MTGLIGVVRFVTGHGYSLVGTLYFYENRWFIGRENTKSLFELTKINQYFDYKPNRFFRQPRCAKKRMNQ